MQDRGRWVAETHLNKLQWQAFEDSNQYFFDRFKRFLKTRHELNCFQQCRITLILQVPIIMFVTTQVKMFGITQFKKLFWVFFIPEAIYFLPKLFSFCIKTFFSNSDLLLTL